MTTHTGLASYLNQAGVLNRFRTIMGEKTGSFVSSIVTAVNMTPRLKECKPETIVSSAMQAALLDLPINKSLGFAHIVPYRKYYPGGNYDTLAQFQLGYKGYIQLAIRTGKYRTINVLDIHDGEIESFDKMTGFYYLNEGDFTHKPVVGYLSFLQLLTGFEKHLFKSVMECKDHGEKYSKGYDREDSIWKTDFPSMSRKLVIKEILSKWGIMSTQMQHGAEVDQAVFDEKDNFSYMDNPVGDKGMNEPVDPVPPSDNQPEDNDEFLKLICDIARKMDIKSQKEVCGIITSYGFKKDNGENIESISEVPENNRSMVVDLFEDLYSKQKST